MIKTFGTNKYIGVININRKKVTLVHYIVVIDYSFNHYNPRFPSTTELLK